MDDHRPPPLRPSRSRRRSRSRNGRGGSASELFVCFPLRRPSWSWGWSSSSMRTPSARSLPSPGRAKEAGGASSLTGSLSRRLRTSGSVKGGQSPGIFSSFGMGGKKKGAGFDGAAPAAAEPSSPKVTCIGQVRVKTGRRKHKKKAAAAAAAAAASAGEGIDGAMSLRSRSRRETGSFRRAGSGDNLAASTRGHNSGCCSCFPKRRDNSWVYLPLGAMCEAIRALACCFKWWRCGRCCGCSCTEEKEEGSKQMSWSWCCYRCSASSTCCSGCCTCDGGGRRKGSQRRGKQPKKPPAQEATVCSCTAAFARCWMMEMHVEKGGRRGGQEKEEVDDEVLAGPGALVMERGRSRRGMAELELVADELERGMWKTVESGVALMEGEGGISADDEITTVPAPPPPPPPNALLLMRCRSDPVKMAVMAPQFVDFPATSKVEIRDVEEKADVVQTNNGVRKPGQPLDAGEERNKEGRKTAAAVEVAAHGRPFTSGVGGGGNDQQQSSCISKPVLEIMEEASGKGGEGDWIWDKREGKQAAQHPASRASQVPLVKSSVAATEGIGISPSKKLPPLPAEVQNRAAIQLPAAKEPPNPKQGVEERSARKEEKRTDLVIPRDRDVRNNAPPLKERRSFSKDKDTAAPAAPGGRRPSVSSSDREDSGAGARRSTSYREGRRSSFSSDSDARRSSFGADNKGEGKRRWSFSSEKDAKRPEAAMGDTAAHRGRTRRDQAGGTDAIGSKCGGVSAPGMAATVEAKGTELPDCLLLMMYEPKLSMEVSKETWVCTADFVRWRPHQPHKHEHQHRVNGVVAGIGEASKVSADQDNVEEAEEEVAASYPPEKTPRIAAADPPPPPHHPSSHRPQLSPSAKWEEAATGTDQKPGSASAVAGAATATASSCGPLTLTRCKSDPVRLSSSPDGMSPEGCFWKSRYLPTAAAGIGF